MILLLIICWLFGISAILRGDMTLIDYLIVGEVLMLGLLGDRHRIALMRERGYTQWAAYAGAVIVVVSWPLWTCRYLLGRMV